jgi:hypothetical protein
VIESFIVAMIPELEEFQRVLRTPLNPELARQPGVDVEGSRGCTPGG